MRGLLAIGLLCCGCAVAHQAGEHPIIATSIVVVVTPAIAAVPFRLCGWHRWFEATPTR